MMLETPSVVMYRDGVTTAFHDIETDWGVSFDLCTREMIAALKEEITGIIERDMLVACYTRVIAESPTIARLVSDLRALRAREGHGLPGFVVPASQVI